MEDSFPELDWDALEGTLPDYLIERLAKETASVSPRKDCSWSLSDEKRTSALRKAPADLLNLQ